MLSSEIHLHESVDPSLSHPNPTSIQIQLQPDSSIISRHQTLRIRLTRNGLMQISSVFSFAHFSIITFLRLLTYRSYTTGRTNFDISRVLQQTAVDSGVVSDGPEVQLNADPLAEGQNVDPSALRLSVSHFFHLSLYS